jgi:succinate dehydrogenase / fumarate reductase cytochrome b subunit
MNRARQFYRAAIGKKVVMGITGLIGVGYLILHMAGNLLSFAGPDAINGYARFLKSTGELLWLARAILLAAVVLHVIAAVQLTLQNRAARPVGYVKREPQVSTWGVRTMRLSGAILLAFIFLHVLHFTTGDWQPGGSFSHTDVYANLASSFRIWWVALFYVVAMMALGLHLYHGAWSSVRSLGLSQPSKDPQHRTVAMAIAVILWLGFTAVPVAFFAGWIG